jgi:hypothetical protein
MCRELTLALLTGQNRDPTFAFAGIYPGLTMPVERKPSSATSRPRKKEQPNEDHARRRCASIGMHTACSLINQTSFNRIRTCMQHSGLLAG